jgi:hypothetical protein
MNRLLCLLILLIWNSETKAQTPFYQGKTITVVAAASAGSLYDLYARLMAQFMGKHIPTTTGEELEALAKQVISQSPEVVERVKILMSQ